MDELFVEIGAELCVVALYLKNITFSLVFCPVYISSASCPLVVADVVAIMRILF